MNNTLHKTNGGWAALRSVNYDGIGIAFDFPYHQVTPIISSGEWDEMVAWCVNTLGPSGTKYGPSGTKENPGVWTANERWYVNNAKFWFRDKKDCEWFLLKWQ